MESEQQIGVMLATLLTRNLSNSLLQHYPGHKEEVDELAQTLEAGLQCGAIDRPLLAKTYRAFLWKTY